MGVGVKYIYFPSTIAQMGYDPFYRGSSVQYIKIEKGTLNITFNATLPKINGKKWYLNDSVLADYSAISISSTTDNIYICK